MPRYKHWRVQITAGDIPINFIENGEETEIKIGDYDATEISIRENVELLLQVKIKKEKIDNVFDTEVIEINCGKPWDIIQPNKRDHKSFRHDDIESYRFIVVDKNSKNEKIIAGFDKFKRYSIAKKETHREGLFHTVFDLEGEIVWKIDYGSDEELPTLRLNKKLSEGISSSPIKKYIDACIIPKFVRGVIEDRNKDGTLIPEEGDKTYWIKWYQAISQIWEINESCERDFDGWLDDFEQEFCSTFNAASKLSDKEEESI